MAKTDIFFLRASLNIGQSATFAETEIDLGSYVNALEKSVLRIKSVSCAFTDSGGTNPEMDATSSAQAQFQLTTQSQTDTILPADTSIIATGAVVSAKTTSSSGVGTFVGHDLDVGPSNWSDGMLVAVDTIYLGGEASSGFNEDVYVSIILECQVETLTQAKAMALALTQQGV